MTKQEFATLVVAMQAMYEPTIWVAEASDENREIKKSISLTKIEHDRIKDILNIIRQLDNLNTIFIFDELDKMNIDVLESLFEKYKCLFVENNIFNFFLVDDEMYLKYRANGRFP